MRKDYKTKERLIHKSKDGTDTFPSDSEEVINS